MTNRQVITIGPDGSISGLQRKPGQGIDLRTFGKADITRASLVEWDADAQAWFINVLQDAGKGVITMSNLTTTIPDVRLSELAPNGWFSSEGTLLLNEYDDAVKVEIAYLDALRLKGQH